MPIDVRRFGVGHRRPDGPAGTTGIAAQVIHSDGRGVIVEMAFARSARIEPHSNPNTTHFVVIEGGGWVQVGDERARIAAGEAAIWPAYVPHGAWTEHTPMRAIVVEFAGADDSHVLGMLEGQALALEPGRVGAADKGDGRLAEHDRPVIEDPSSGEPR